ncbi:NADP-dependent oxidoreductase [Blastococcus sp. LR1]|uniref:NADP-dependent oxidoreductase n=1 Tax=Blastococcus sp. LR1 TaxID=2877000 RepID=UPI001CCF3170|nr:NADP-dependent oxidoreductase [Blastococcus sp. LR1]MCA0144337.1 NADP-dependent oxidoreductase [Blastococcus sp. LR1]
MRAITFSSYGGPEVLEPADLDRPVPGPGQALVRVAATSFNPVDGTIRAGYLQQVLPLRLPHVPGFDLAGTVTAVGPGGPEELIGADVVAFLPMTEPGAAAEYVLAPVELLTRAPRSVPLADAAALPSAGLTAWQALVEHAGLAAGQRLLVNGAGGGVGGYAVQLAAELGATVIATASPRSAAAVTAAGAHQVVDHTRTPVTEAVTEPVDVVLNLVRTSPEETAALIGLVRRGGVFVSTTTPGEADAERGVRASSVFVRSDAAQLASLVDRVDAGTLRLDVSVRYPLEQLAEVHARGEAGELRGKVVITVEER